MNKFSYLDTIKSNKSCPLCFKFNCTQKPLIQFERNFLKHSCHKCNISFFRDFFNKGKYNIFINDVSKINININNLKNIIIYLDIIPNYVVHFIYQPSYIKEIQESFYVNPSNFNLEYILKKINNRINLI